MFIGASDVTDAQYDPIRKTYLLHYKIWRVDGEVVASRLPRGNAHAVSYWPTWQTVKLDGSKVRFQGQLVDFSSDDTSPISGSIDFAREPKSRRVVARAESRDLVHWTDARVVVEIRDAEGIPVPGFQFADSSEFHGDAVSQPIAWQGRAGDLGQFKGKPIPLAFRIKHAELYAFQFLSLNPQ